MTDKFEKCRGLKPTTRERCRINATTPDGLCGRHASMDWEALVARYDELSIEAITMYRKGWGTPGIARALSDQGHVTENGRPLTAALVGYLLHRWDDSPPPRPIPPFDIDKAELERRVSELIPELEARDARHVETLHRRANRAPAELARTREQRARDRVENELRWGKENVDL